MRRVLHIEVGGAYGGSTKELELYLRSADRSRFNHEVLFYFPTREFDTFRRMADTSVLVERSPAACPSSGKCPSFKRLLQRSQIIKDIVALGRAQRLTQKLARFMRSGRYDVVHVNNSFGYQPASILAGRIARVPVIAHVRNPIMFTAVTEALARQVAQFVVVNQSLADTYAGRPVSYIREAIEAEPPPRDVLIRTRSGFNPARLTVASVGRLDEQKGFAYLIHAAQIVCRTRPDVIFLIAGEGSLREPLQALINSAGLASQVYLLGFRADPQIVIAASDIFVCSSLWEGSPLAVLEAMALGVPTVSTNVGVVPEVIIHGKSGWLIQPRNSESLARAILGAADSSKEARAKIIAAARSAVAPFQDTAGLARQFEAALEKTN